MSVDVSVVIPVYNAEPYIERCIQGLLAQDFPRDRYEVLFVDNNSPDNSSQIIKRYEPDVRFLHEGKQGSYAARNCALREARGKVIAFTDPDCVPETDWLSKSWEALQAEGLHVVVGHNTAPPGSEMLRLMMVYEHHRHAFVFNSTDPTIYYAHTNNLAATRESLDRCGPFVERMRGADTIFVRRVVEEIGLDAVAYGPQMRVEHLEVETIGQYLRKTWLYGRSRNRYRSVMPTRALTFAERIAVWRNAVKGQRISPLLQFRIAIVLVVGVLTYQFGAIAGRGDDPESPGTGSSGVALPSGESG